MMVHSPDFHVVSGTTVADYLAVNHAEVVVVVRQTYLDHRASRTHNPDSYFLRFSDKLEARIIALPAALRTEQPISGIKWIASYPNNIHVNRQRASAVLLLNDYDTGYPFACIEASQISAARTAASAVLAAETLGRRRRGTKLAVIGAGVIARTIIEYFKAMDWRFDEICIHDVTVADAQRLAALSGPIAGHVGVATTFVGALTESSHVVFATTAAEPYLADPTLLTPGQIVLNISLRDITPKLLLTACNIFDDVEHCMKAGTSAHLAEQLAAGRDFVAGTLADVLAGSLTPDATKPIIFSPFGLGVLDIAVGRRIFEWSVSRGAALNVEGFFHDVARW